MKALELFLDSAGPFLIIATICFIVGVGLGYSAEQESWTKDCVALGQHRDGNKVYACSAQGKTAQSSPGRDAGEPTK